MLHLILAFDYPDDAQARLPAVVWEPDRRERQKSSQKDAWNMPFLPQMLTAIVKNHLESR